MSYTFLIREAVRRKWHTPAQKEWWYGKLSAVRRRKTIFFYNKQDGKCCFCGEQTYLSADENLLSENRLPRKRTATLEHVIPQKNGGTDHMSNLAMACLGCNNARGVMLFEQFLELRNDPVRYVAFLRRKAGIKGEPNSRRAKEKKAEKVAKRNARLQRRAYELAVLFMLVPGIQQLFEQAVADLEAQLANAYNNRENRIKRVMEKYA